MKKRTRKLQDILVENQISALLISDPSNITYLTGVSPLSRYEREGFVFVTQKQLQIFSSSFSFDKFSEAKVFNVTRLSREKSLSSCIKESTDSSDIYVETANLNVEEYNQIQDKTQKKLVPFDKEILRNLRMIKDAHELKQIKNACEITEKAFTEIFSCLKAGMTEVEIAHGIIRLQNKFGSDGIPFGFEPIVAFGPYGARPHHNPGKTTLKKETPILFDFGSCVDGYASDFTRTIWFGNKPTEHFLDIEKHVKAAYKLGLEKSVVGNKVSQIDQAVFDYFEEHKLQDKFIHTTGHGIGLDVHEKPSIYRNTSQDVIIQKGMVLTIEPGLYFSGEFGYRYENTVFIK